MKPSTSRSSSSRLLFALAALAGSLLPIAARAQSGAPVITSAATLDVYYQVELQGGNVFSYRIAATNSPTSYGASGLPSTATLTASTGSIFGNSSFPGLYTVGLSATNASGTGTAPLRLAIHPAIIGVSSSGNTAYPAGTPLTIALKFNTPVGVTGTPSVTLSLGAPASGTREAPYVSGSGSDTLVFAYTPGAADVSSTVVPFSTLSLNGGSIQDGNGLAAGAGLPAQQTSGAFSATSFTANSTGSAGSGSAGASPRFVVQPSSLAIATGSMVILSGQASAGSAVGYQWTHNGTAISGATSPTLLISEAAATAAGDYALVATNATGSTASSTATLSVVASANPGRLLNLSILSGVRGSLTLGFVVGGNGAAGSENVLIRGLGPALTAFGVSGVLPDPTVTAMQQSSRAIVAADAGWAGQHQVQTADAATGAFPLTDPASLDSAVVAALPMISGGYTVQVAGKSGDSGTALAEVYDNTANYTAASPRLINLSCLTPLAASGSLSAGFVIGGDTAKTVLIRALGPALSAFGVATPMPDPSLTVHSQGSSTVVATDQGSAASAQISAVAASVGAFQVSSGSNQDSAVLITLAPGAYTADVASVSGVSGSVLVEVYDVQ